MSTTQMQPVVIDEATQQANEDRKVKRSEFGATTAERDAKAWLLKSEGKTWAQVAAEMGYANGAVARRAGLRHAETRNLG